MKFYARYTNRIDLIDSNRDIDLDTGYVLEHDNKTGVFALLCNVTSASVQFKDYAIQNEKSIITLITIGDLEGVTFEYLVDGSYIAATITGNRVEALITSLEPEITLRITSAIETDIKILDVEIKTYGYQELDLLQGKNISISKSIKDVSQPDKIKGSTSQKIKLLNSDRNNSFFRFLSEGGNSNQINRSITFDAYLENDFSTVLRGSMYVFSIEMDKTGEKIYNVVLYDNITSPFKTLSMFNLQDISLPSTTRGVYNMEFVNNVMNFATVEELVDSGYCHDFQLIDNGEYISAEYFMQAKKMTDEEIGGGYLATSHSGLWVTDFKPVFMAAKIFEYLHTVIGYTFEMNLGSQRLFKRLAIISNQYATDESLKEQAFKFIQTDDKTLINAGEYLIEANTIEYGGAYLIDSGGSSLVNAWNVNKGVYAKILFKIGVTAGMGSVAPKYQVKIKNANTDSYSKFIIPFELERSDSSTTWQVLELESEEMFIASDGINAIDFTIEKITNDGFTDVFDYTTVEASINTISNKVAPTGNIDLSTCIPNIPAIDFVSDIIKMFNLFVEVDNNAKHIKYSTFNMYYDLNDRQNISNKLIKNKKDIENINSSKITNRYFSVKYKGLDGAYAEDQINLHAREYGEYYLDTKNEITKKKLKVSLKGKLPYIKHIIVAKQDIYSGASDAFVFPILDKNEEKTYWNKAWGTALKQNSIWENPELCYALTEHKRFNQIGFEDENGQPIDGTYIPLYVYDEHFDRVYPMTLPTGGIIEPTYKKQTLFFNRYEDNVTDDLLSEPDLTGLSKRYYRGFYRLFTSPDTEFRKANIILTEAEYDAIKLSTILQDQDKEYIINKLNKWRANVPSKIELTKIDASKLYFDTSRFCEKILYRKFFSSLFNPELTYELGDYTGSIIDINNGTFIDYGVRVGFWGAGSTVNRPRLIIPSGEHIVGHDYRITIQYLVEQDYERIIGVSKSGDDTDIQVENISIPNNALHVIEIEYTRTSGDLNNDIIYLGRSVVTGVYFHIRDIEVRDITGVNTTDDCPPDYEAQP